MKIKIVTKAKSWKVEIVKKAEPNKAKPWKVEIVTKGGIEKGKKNRKGVNTSSPLRQISL